MIGALSLQKFIALLYFALVARQFGALITGEFFFATSVGMLLTVLFDSGQSALLIAESATDLEAAQRDFRRMLAAKLLLALLVGVVGIGVLIWLSIHSLFVDFLILIFFSSVCESLQMSFYGLLRAHQRHSIEAVAGVFGALLELAIGVLVWRGVLPLPMLVGAFLVANIFHLLLAAGIVRYSYTFSLRPDFSVGALQNWFKRTAPFAMAAYCVKVGTYTDSVLLRSFGGATAVGLYSIPFKTSFSWLFIPQGLVATLFPAMSFFARADQQKLERSFHRAVELLLFFAAPLSFGVAATAPTFIPTIFGQEYAPSILLSQMLAIVIFPLFLQYPIGSLLNATERAASYTRLLGITTVTNMVANALLIPQFGATGAMIAAMLSHSLLVILGVVEAGRVVEIHWKALGSTALRILSAAGLMFQAVQTVSHTSLGAQIIVGFVVYVALTWLFGVWKIADLRKIQPA